MSTKVSFLAISLAVVLLPWLVWQIRPVRRVAPLAVVQITVGVLLGPSCFEQFAPSLHAALFSQPVMAGLDGVSSLGVLLYVFVTGLHVDRMLLRQGGRRLAAVAAGSVAVPLLLGAAAGAWMVHAIPGAAGPGDGGFIAAVALCIAVTALPVLAAILQEMGLIHTRLGQSALAVAALNDAALWIMLALLLAFSGPIGHAHALLGLGAAILWFALMLLVVPRVLAKLAQSSDGTILAIGVALALLSALISEALGTGYLIGAFSAGLVMPPSRRAALLMHLEPVAAAVLLPFFFLSTGLKAHIEPGSASFLGALAAATLATVIGKLAGTALPARWAGFSWPDSVSLGVLLQTKGLMEVVVLSALHEAGLVGTPIFSSMVAMAVICTLLTAPLVRAIHSLRQRLVSPHRGADGCELDSAS